MHVVPGVSLNSVSGSACDGNGTSVSKDAAVPKPVLVTVSVPVSHWPRSTAVGLRTTDVVRVGRLGAHWKETVVELVGPTMVTEVDRPAPVLDGAVADNVPTACDAPAPTLPTLHTGASGADYLAVQVTPAAGTSVTTGWPVTKAGSVTVTLVLPCARVPGAATEIVDEPARTGDIP